MPTTQELEEVEEHEGHEQEDMDVEMNDHEDDHVEEVEHTNERYTLPTRPASSSPPEFNLTRDFASPPPPPPEDEVDLSVLPERVFASDSDDHDFVPDRVSDDEPERPKSPPKQTQASRRTYSDRIKTYAKESDDDTLPTSFRNTDSVRPRKKNKGIALEVTQLDTDEPEYMPKVTMVDFVSQMVLETLEQELGKNVDDEQREIIEMYIGELKHRFLELTDINNAVYLQRLLVQRRTRVKNSHQEALLKVSERLNEAKVEADRRGREYAEKKRGWEDTRFVNEFLHDVDEVNNSLKGVESSGVEVEQTVFDKLAYIEDQTQLLGRLRKLNSVLEGAGRVLSKSDQSMIL